MMNLTEEELLAIRCFGPAPRSRMHAPPVPLQSVSAHVWQSLRQKGLVRVSFDDVRLSPAGKDLLSLMMGCYTVQPIAAIGKEADA